MRLLVVLLLGMSFLAGCGARPGYSARTLVAEPGSLLVPAGASIAVLTVGQGPVDSQISSSPEAASERLIRVLKARGFAVRRITDGELETCTETYVLRLQVGFHEKDAGGAPGDEPRQVVTVELMEMRTRRVLGRTRMLLTFDGPSLDGPSAEDLVVRRTLGWLEIRGTLEPWRTDPPRSGGFFVETTNTTALFTRKTVKQDIPFYQARTDWERLSLQNYAFGLGFGFEGTPLEMTLAFFVHSSLTQDRTSGGGLQLGLEYELPSSRPVKTTIWGRGTAGLFNIEGNSGMLWRLTAGAGLSWSPWSFFRLYARAGLGGQWLDTVDLDVTWDRPRDLGLDSFVVQLDAGLSLNW
ncbi:hypothetical protein KJ975_07200 [Myxococcota bacterium]|nr:hypothetical protein [Myxococcota bacterium]